MVKAPASQQTYGRSEVLAAEDLLVRLTPEYVRSVRAKLQEKARRVEGSVQYYALFANSEWAKDEIDDRIFGATRLLYEYTGPSGGSVPNLDARITELKQLILRLADEKGAPELPIVSKIKNGDITLLHSSRFALRVCP